MRRHHYLIALFALLALGCGRTDYPPVSIDAAREVETGTPLAEVKKELGEPHPPTAAQQERLDQILTRMPEQTRSNAQRDKSLAWGNDDAFLVVKVNDKGIIWVKAWQSGQAPPIRIKSRR